MKVAIVGSRSFDDYPLLTKIFESIEDKVTLIVSGGANGADKLAEKLAKDKGLPLKVFPADWDRHGISAGVIRNAEIINNSDYVLAFWDGKSKGTYHSIKLARKKNIPTNVITF